jgi:hypothetical protein
LGKRNFGLVTKTRYRTHISGWFTNIARYQTYVQKLSIDNAFSSCDIEAGFDGERRQGSAASNKSWLAGETPKRPATLWTVTYRMGPSFRGLWWTKALGKTGLLSL